MQSPIQIVVTLAAEMRRDITALQAKLVALEQACLCVESIPADVEIRTKIMAKLKPMTQSGSNTFKLRLDEILKGRKIEQITIEDKRAVMALLGGTR